MVNYLDNRTHQNLQQAFSNHGLSIEINHDHITVQNSPNQTAESIQKIIESIKFCPLVSEKTVNGPFSFTITPYEIPKFFNATNYFSLEEITELLEPVLFCCQREDFVKSFIDKWKLINQQRKMVFSAHNKALSEILSPNVKGEYPVIEIGSGAGYTLPENFSSKIIRIQPDFWECQLLKQSISDSVYQLDIQRLHCFLFETEKKIPLFFALNVFDTMPSDERKVNLQKIAELQGVGDQIIIMLDTNPFINTVLPEIKAQYPDHAVLPYLPITSRGEQLSVIIVPLELWSKSPTAKELLEITLKQYQLTASERKSQLQTQLQELKEKHSLKVISLESFFADQIKSELHQIGYQCDSYYHASFSTIDGHPDTQDIHYKSVTDTTIIRLWSIEDKNFHNKLAEKGLKIPDYINKSFISDLKNKGQKIVGSEFLVIKAVKT